MSDAALIDTDKGFPDRRFLPSKGDSSAKREIIAAAAMAYIIATKSQAGMDRGEPVISTAVAAIFACVMIRLAARARLPASSAASAPCSSRSSARPHC